MSEYDYVMTEEKALSWAVTACALHGQHHMIVNANLDEVWSIEADTKVDDSDLSYPVIVHMRGGTIATDGLAILIPGKVVQS